MAIIVGCQIFDVELNRNRLGFIRLQQPGLLECDEIRRRLFDAPIGIWRIIIDFNHVFTCRGSRIGHGDVEFHRTGLLVIGDIAHTLVERRIAQTVSERILHHVIVIDHPFHCGGLIVFVSDVDAFHIVDKCRKRICREGVIFGNPEFFHVVPCERTEIVE